VIPAKVLAFAKGPFGQTRHRFSVPARAALDVSLLKDGSRRARSGLSTERCWESE
jgi:hypothetical protein